MRTLRRFIAPLLLVLGAAPLAWAALISKSTTYTIASADCPSGSSPSATGAMTLSGLKGFRVCLFAELTPQNGGGTQQQTLTGTGALRACVFSTTQNKWVRTPGLDWTVPTTANGLTAVCFPDQQTWSPRGAVAYFPSSTVGQTTTGTPAAGVTSGATVVVAIEGVTQ